MDDVSVYVSEHSELFSFPSIGPISLLYFKLQVSPSFLLSYIVNSSEYASNCSFNTKYL